LAGSARVDFNAFERLASKLEARSDAFDARAFFGFRTFARHVFFRGFEQADHVGLLVFVLTFILAQRYEKRKSLRRPPVENMYFLNTKARPAQAFSRPKLGLQQALSWAVLSVLK
jgi:hypothetical protein